MSSAVNPEFIERYQIEYQKNPKSKVFAPLAEAYRKMGLLDEAQRICAAGVQLHPEFASGRVAFAKILLERKNLPAALEQLERAVQLSPDNLLAHTLMGDILLELRRPKDALKAYKMVLFINPQDEKALATVRKWEFLTADEYDAELFRMQPLTPVVSPSIGIRDAPEPPAHRELERALSLADAFTVRNDVERAIDVLTDAKKSLGPQPEILNRLTLLERRMRTMELESEDAGADEAEVRITADELDESTDGDATPEHLEPVTKTASQAIPQSPQKLLPRSPPTPPPLPFESLPVEIDEAPTRPGKSLRERIAAAVAEQSAPPLKEDTTNALRVRKRSHLESLLRRINERRNEER